SRQWLRRTIDLISALVLLRATLLTRITGDAGIPGQRAAAVPVGRIGAEDVETSLTRSVAAFLHEGTVNVRGGAIPEPLRPQVVGAIKDVQATFRNLRWTGALSDPSRRSIADEAFLREIKAVACGGLLPLLPGGRDGALPDSLYGLGPIWLERWCDVPAEEAFGFDGAFGADRQRMRRLLAGCRTIANTRELPSALRRAARDLIAILHRPDQMLEISYVARKAVESERVWICLPIDYDRFCTLPPGEENAGKRFRSEEPEHWLDSLLRASSTNTMLSAYHPVLPDYSGRPFLAMIAPGDPTGLERTFDDRYFMASSELNLLNTLLFVDNSMPEATGEHAAGCST
ncbi:MAG TPA: hypothetical protein VGW38_16040, partial [Chloroflexota bacterium]|nr:hypothetical protein [Chloroflexota bacterium]